MDGMLHKQLTKNVFVKVKKKDRDWVVVIDGEEGSGKSVLAFQIAKILDPNFSVDNVAFTANDFIRIVKNAKKFSCVVFDEAFTGLSSRASLSEMNRLLVSLMMEMRQRNLFIIIVMPTFFMLDKYAVLHRARGLFHVKLRNDKRGYWNYYPKKKMKVLYLKGKQYFEYHHTKPAIFGKFLEQYTINEAKYRSLKKQALEMKQRNTRAEVYKSQRDILIYEFYKYQNVSILNFSKFIETIKIGLQKRVIDTIINEVGDKKAKKEQEVLEEEEKPPDLAKIQG